MTYKGNGMSPQIRKVAILLSGIMVCLASLTIGVAQQSDAYSLTDEWHYNYRMNSSLPTMTGWLITKYGGIENMSIEGQISGLEKFEYSSSISGSEPVSDGSIKCYASLIELDYYKPGSEDLLRSVSQTWMNITTMRSSPSFPSHLFETAKTQITVINETNYEKTQNSQSEPVNIAVGDIWVEELIVKSNVIVSTIMTGSNFINKSVLYSNETYLESITHEVASEGNVTVPDGIFYCTEIIETAMINSSLQWTLRRWVNDSVGMDVKYVIEFPNGGVETARLEAYSYTPSKSTDTSLSNLLIPITVVIIVAIATITGSLILKNRKKIK